MNRAIRGARSFDEITRHIKVGFSDALKND